LATGTALFRLHRAVIDPRRRGLALGVVRAALWPVAALYGLVVRARNALYRAGWLKAHTAPVPVISIGNITAGGTGKTPMVAWLSRLLIIHKMRPAVLSRGYGRDPASGLDDENRMLARLADAPILADPNRVRGAARAVAEHGADVLIMDDGFQHRRLARDLDVVLIDALWPFGADHMLPRGLLREPLAELRRADFLVVTRANLVSAGELAAILERLSALAPRTPVAVCGIAVAGLRPLAGAPAPGPDGLRRGQWATCCGIGNPEGFLRILEEAGCRLGLIEIFPDHQPYSAAQVRAVLERARAGGCDAVVTTEKDAVKMEPLLRDMERPAPPVYALQIEMDFTEGSAALTNAILKAAGRSA